MIIKWMTIAHDNSLPEHTLPATKGDLRMAALPLLLNYQALQRV